MHESFMAETSYEEPSSAEVFLVHENSGMPCMAILTSKDIVYINKQQAMDFFGLVDPSTSLKETNA